MDPNRRHHNHEKWNEEMAVRHDPDTFITKSGLPIRWVQNDRLKRVCSLLKSESGESLLDAGCGSGNLLNLLHQGKLTGLDLSDSLLKQAKEKLKDRPDVTLIKGDLEKMPFADNTFDRVVCSEVLEHVSSPLQVLREIHRVAKPSARVVLTLPNESLINFTKRIVLWAGLRKMVAGRYHMSDNMLDEWHLREVSISFIKQLCEKLFSFEGHYGVPFRFLPYHNILVFKVTNKT